MLDYPAVIPSVNIYVNDYESYESFLLFIITGCQCPYRTSKYFSEILQHYENNFSFSSINI